MKYHEFIPVKLSEDVYTFAIPVAPCPSCGTPTLRPALSHEAAFWRQAQVAGIRRSFEHNKIDGKNVCEVCFEKYIGENFECDHCNRVWSKLEIKFRYDANGTGYLCDSCYNTLTAAQWDEAIKEVKAMYQYSD